MMNRSLVGGVKSTSYSSRNRPNELSISLFIKPVNTNNGKKIKIPIDRRMAFLLESKPMGTPDSFYDKPTGLEGQLKCLEAACLQFDVGDRVPVEEFGFPKSCTFADWGGTSQMFHTPNLMREDQTMGTFVIVEDGKLRKVSNDESDIIYPVFSKYGGVLAKSCPK